MGEVYRARDTNLGRDVAIKILSESFVHDAERMDRFQREARVLASLNHPRIGAIYGLEDSADLRALVLELVEGRTLADRIKPGPIPLEDTLRIAQQITEALEYAHERGIVHRDLKPANVGLGNDEEVKVLDFGLAKALQGDGNPVDNSGSRTISQLGTQAGIILGTAAYMSPEQAKGKPVDRRTDIWAFGCVLFEMLSGKTPFGGETLTDTLALVVMKEPDWSQIPTATPVAIGELLRRCLNKDPRRRLQAIGEARIVLEEVQAGSTDEEQLSGAQRKAQLRGSAILRWALPWALLAIVSSWLLFFRAPSASTKTNLTAVLFSGPDTHSPAISPDGRVVAFEHEAKIWIRGVDELEPRVLAGTEDGQSPFWSPDGKSIGYFHNGELRRTSAQGGPSTLICQLISNQSLPPATWGADGRIVFQDIPKGLFEVSAQGGTPRLFATPDRSKDEMVLRHPHFLADGKTLIIAVRRHDTGKGTRFDTIALQSGTNRSVVWQLPDATILSVLSSEKTGHLLYAESSPNPGVWAVPFSFSRLKATGRPFLVSANANDPSLSSNGELVYLMGSAAEVRELAWVDLTGRISGAFGNPQADGRDPSVSPDGTRVAFAAGEPKWGIWVADSLRNTTTSIGGTTDAVAFPQWLDNGKRLAFRCRITTDSKLSFCTGLSDGTGEPQAIVSAGPGLGFSFSPDQKTILWSKRAENRQLSIWRAPFEKGAKWEPFSTTQFNELSPRISPNGRFVAYQSDESGRYEIYVRPFPSGEGRWMISTHGGTTPKWSPRGDELFYLQGDALMAISVKSNSDFRVDLPRELFSGKKVGSSMVSFDSPLFDVAPDGKRFVVFRDAVAGPGSVVADQNWLAKSEKGKE